ncbi:MAG: proteinase inhibitor I4 serpin [Candidatus Marinimicrobia bacterium]|nr:proteinase inhibitor I4 serpin [Candidatus Neomarinimicrobiota bacterium]
MRLRIIRPAVLFPLALLFSVCSDPCWKEDSACKLEPDVGHCEAAIIRYYFDKRSGDCEFFYWGGCDGTAPFETMEECEEACLCANG